jgi:hypothetical protein
MFLMENGASHLQAAQAEAKRKHIFFVAFATLSFNFYATRRPKCGCAAPKRFYAAACAPSKRI